MFNFPNSPADGTVYSPVGGPTYVFSSGVWKLTGGGSSFVVSSDVAPAEPFPGMLWFESDTGALFFWYVDADSSQWVQINFTPSGVRTAETRNRIVNGAAQISQENESVVGTTTSYYLADQWMMSFTNVTGVSAQRLQASGSPGPLNRLRIANTTADTTIATNDNLYLQQRIEGMRMADFEWGTSEAKPAVLRFSVYSTVAGTYSVNVRDSPTTVSWVGQFIIAAGEVSTWVERSIAIPATQTGAWSTDNTIGAILSFTLVAGPTLTGVNGWQSGNVIAGAGQVNFMATANNVFNVSNIGLHLDPQGSGVAPPWQTPDPVQELEVCRRYFGRYFDGTVNNQSSSFLWTNAGPITSMYCYHIDFSTEMRAVPTVIGSAVHTYTNASAGSYLSNTSSTTLRATVAALGQYRAQLGGYVYADARL